MAPTPPEDLVDLAALDDAEASPSVSAPDPETKPDPGMTFAELFISNYIPIEVAMTGHTKDPRTGTQLRIKAADIALQLTQNIIFRRDREAGVA